MHHLIKAAHTTQTEQQRDTEKEGLTEQLLHFQLPIPAPPQTGVGTICANHNHASEIIKYSPAAQDCSDLLT